MACLFAAEDTLSTSPLPLEMGILVGLVEDVDPLDVADAWCADRSSPAMHPHGL